MQEYYYSMRAPRAGLVAFIAQAKYDSIILEVVTFSSAIVLAVRVILGYKRMYDRCAIAFLSIHQIRTKPTDDEASVINAPPLTYTRPFNTLRACMTGASLLWGEH